MLLIWLDRKRRRTWLGMTRRRRTEDSRMMMMIKNPQKPF